jgi:predicted Zn-dependent protease
MIRTPALRRATALMLATGCCVAAAGPVEDRLRAQELIRQSRCDLARPLLEDLVRRAPSADHTYLLGLCELRVGDPERALELLAAATDARPDRPAWLDTHAEALATIGRCDRGVELLDRAIALDDTARYRYDRAMCRLDLGQIDAAEADLRRSLELAPRAVPTMVQLGGILLATGRFADAAAVLGTALEVDPEHVEAAALLARLQLASGDVDSAVASARAVLSRVPNHTSATYTLGRALMAAGRADEGRAVLDRSRELAVAEDAIANLQDYLATAPEDTGARLELGRRLLDLGRTAEALAELERVGRSAPDNREALVLLAEAQERLGADRAAQGTRDRLRTLEGGRP